ncbi:MAG: hypothetical protein AB9903_23015 [Vulcanimicrobiota bacterium]
MNTIFRDKGYFMRKMASALTPFSILLLLLSMTFLSAGPASAFDSSAPADDEESKLVVLQIPLQLIGDYLPITAKEVREIIESSVEDTFPNVDVVIADPNDEKTKGITLSGDMAASDVRKLAKAYGADFIIWGTLKFTNSQKSEVIPYSPVIQTRLSIEAVENLKVYSAKDAQVIIDQPMIQANNETTRANEISETFKELEKTMVRKCVKDISVNMMKSIKNSFSKKGL